MTPPDDDDVLEALGIKPELSRKMGTFGNYAISLTIICVLAGGMSLFGYGLGHGGPVVMLGSWVVIGGLTLLVGMSLADVVSAYPTSGGPYFMAEKLGGKRWAWFAGWLNLLGLLGGTAGVDYGAAQFIGALAQLQWGIAPTSTSHRTRARSPASACSPSAGNQFPPSYCARSTRASRSTASVSAVVVTRLQRPAAPYVTAPRCDRARLFASDRKERAGHQLQGARRFATIW
ncbi:amino acid permease [Streptomyces sp. NBC_00989]|uniref:amino acid permease n=1 Tax=Streptomyces sp. NBC_00989 TaxID=2903705 RepID=UPI0038634578|nr:amino acid permease [Streptomyces sp. NBC_00989]